jgi:polyisoprenoid-binding protein YceI
MAKRTKILLGVGIVLVVLVGGGAYWLLKDDAAPRANLEDAAARAGEDTGDSSGTSQPDSTDTPAVDVSGVWVVGPNSFVGYRIDEVLTIGNNTATARTDQVTGTLAIDGAMITEVSMTVGMASLTSTDGNGFRDGRVRDSLDTANTPEATFVLIEPIDLGTVPAEGEPLEVTAVGELTLKGTTQPVEVAIQAQVSGTNLLVVGNAPVVLSDYGIAAPSAARVVSIEDAGELEFELIFERA